MQIAISATLMSGGDSRALYIDNADLPNDIDTRDAVLLAMMGSPDIRQIDGVPGSATPVTLDFRWGRFQLRCSVAYRITG